MRVEVENVPRLLSFVVGFYAAQLREIEGTSFDDFFFRTLLFFGRGWTLFGFLFHRRRSLWMLNE